MVGINVGCGPTPTAGWRNFDNSLSVRLARFPRVANLLCRLRLLAVPQYALVQAARQHHIEYANAAARLPVADGSADVLYSSHMLEHLDRDEAVAFLAEAHRVLRPGGVLRLAVPDLHQLAADYVQAGDADVFMSNLLVTTPRPRTLWQRLRLLLAGSRHHQWMYDGASLCRLLAANGFTNPAVLPPGQTRIPDLGGLDLAERAATSVYVEAAR